MTNYSTNNALWVIRSVEERTTDLCEQLVRQIAPPDQVVVIHERPFSAALHKGFELGATSELKWTVCIDADVLIHAEGIVKLLEVAETVDERIFYVQGLTLDKLIPIKRPPGNGIYRNALMRKAKQFVPQEGTSLRPETTTMRGMIASGHLMYRTNMVVGLHDFEQSYEDIYRKSFLHARKHANVLPLVEAYWKAHQATDRDFEVALLGSTVGKTYGDTVYVDKRFQQEEWQILRQMKSISEKLPLDHHAYPPSRIREVVETFVTDPELQQRKFPQYQENYLMWPSVPLHRKVRQKLLRGIGTAFVKGGKLAKRAARAI